MSRTNWYVNQMDREAKAGRDPYAWLTTHCAGNLRTAESFQNICKQEYAARLANRAKKFERDAKAQNTHCQICERPILSNTGLIAHHGYQRPGHGNQTASCFGARHLAYEQSRNLLPVYIAMEKDYAEGQEAFAASLHLAPPDSFTTYPHTDRRTGRTDYGRPELLARPPGFDPEAALGIEHHDRNKYEKHWVHIVEEARQQAAWARREIARCEQRYADWKPPTP